MGKDIRGVIITLAYPLVNKNLPISELHSQLKLSWLTIQAQNKVYCGYKNSSRSLEVTTDIQTNHRIDNKLLLQSTMRQSQSFGHAAFQPCLRLQ